MNVNPEAFRTAAMAQGLAEADLEADPIRQFQRWYEDAIAQDLPEPNAMSLATVDAQGRPSLRTVLLKLYDRQGFVFFTNYESRKSLEIGGNPRVALLFPWVALARQVQITGTARRIPTMESFKYFTTRPRGSQLGAWASPQSRVISSRSLLEQQVAEIERRFGQGEVPLPHFWGGYRVEPAEIEFWQGRDCRLHDRFRYRRTGEAADDGSGGGSAGWTVERLAP